MRILLIRHGDPDYRNDTLTPKGHAEAKALADYLKEHEPPTKLFTSPLGRARATAAYTEKVLGLTAGVEDWARELPRMGMEQHGMAAWDLHAHIIRSAARPSMASEEEWNALTDWADLPMQRTMRKVRKGSDDFLSRLGYVRENHHYRVECRNEETVDLFCHGGFGLTWLAHLLAIPYPMVWAGFFLHPASITTILWDERVPGIATPRCLAVGALPHLAITKQKPSPSGIKANYR